MPGKYILAVECYGATYHSSANARDRDRLRQSVLEGIGWRFHRIWSTDWFRHRGKEIVKLRIAIENAIKNSTNEFSIEEKNSESKEINDSDTIIRKKSRPQYYGRNQLL